MLLANSDAGSDAGGERVGDLLQLAELLVREIRAGLGGGVCFS